MIHLYELVVAKPECESIQIDVDSAQTHSLLSRHKKRELVKEALHRLSHLAGSGIRPQHADKLFTRDGLTKRQILETSHHTSRPGGQWTVDGKGDAH